MITVLLVGIGLSVIAGWIWLGGLTSARSAASAKTAPEAQPGLYYLVEQSGIYYAGTGTEGKPWLKGDFASYAIARDGSVAVVDGKNQFTVLSPAGKHTYQTPLAVNVSSWSPDSRYLLYTLRHQPVGSSVHRLDTRTGQSEELLPQSLERSYSGPHYAPDGQQISISILGNHPGGIRAAWAVYIADPSGKQLRFIGKGLDHIWSPDGSMLLVADTGPWTYYDAASGKALKQEQGPGQSPLPLAWGPDNRIYYGYRNGIYLRGQKVMDGDRPVWH